jgi:hypothetical protein
MAILRAALDGSPANVIELVSWRLPGKPSDSCTRSAIRTWIGASIVEMVRERVGSYQPVVREKEPGRNEACLCGSGKKYKKCHGR